MQTVRDALHAMLAQDADHASEKNERGFNRFDGDFARQMAGRATWSRPMENAVLRMLTKYRGQLSSYGFNVKELLLETTEADKAPPKKKREWLPYEEWKAKKDAEAEAQPNVLSFKDGELRLKSKFSFKDQAKSVPNAKWDKESKLWTYPLSLLTAERLLEYVDDGLIEAKPVALKKLRGVAETHERTVNAVEKLKYEKLAACTVPLKTELYEHQIRGFQIGMKIPNSALLMEQGTGKTLTAIAVAGQRYLNGEVKRVLVFAPKSVTGSWKQEVDTYADFPVTAVNITKYKREDRLSIVDKLLKKKTLQVMIINYESSWTNTKKGLASHPVIQKFKPDMVICDESQKIKKHTSKQSRAIHKLGKEVKYKMLLTGTPVSQSPLDFFSQYLFLNPDIFGTRFRPFRDEYCRMGGYMNYQIIGFRNLNKLADKAHSIAFRVTKGECLDLPPTVDQVIHVGMGKEQSAAYQTMAKDMVLTFLEGDERQRVTAPLVITQMTRLQQITGGFLPLTNDNGEKVGIRAVGSGKLDAIGELFETLPKDKKLVVFARFVPEIDAIAQKAKEAGRSFIKFDGRLKEDRAEIVRKFQKEQDPNVFIAQIGTGGVGITLTASDTVIFYSQDFSYVNYEQARARVHRISQTRHVTYIHLVTKGTIDEQVLKVLQSKGDIADLTVDVLKRGAKQMDTLSGSTRDLQKALERIRLQMDEEDGRKTKKSDLPTVEEPIAAPKKERVKTVRDSSGEKVKKVLSGSVITLKELASELDVEPKDLRKKLRKNPKFNKDTGRWEWDSADPLLDEIRAFFKKGKK